MRFIKKFDIIVTNNISFNINLEEKKTCLGGILTILLVVAFILLNFEVFRDCLLKKNPKIKAIKYDLLKDNVGANLTKTHFPFGFKISSHNKNDTMELNHGRFYYPVVFYDEYSEDSNKNNKIQLNLAECNDKELVDFNHVEFIKNGTDFNSKEYFCFDSSEIPNNIMKSLGIKSSEYSFFQIIFRKCYEGEINTITKEKCALENEYFKYMSDKPYIEYFYPSIEISKNNKNLFKKHIVSGKFDLEIGKSSLHDLLFESIKATTQQSMTFSSDNEEGFNLSNKVVNFKEVPDKDGFSQIIIRFTDNYTEYTRTYLGIDNLLSQLGYFSNYIWLF